MEAKICAFTRGSAAVRYSSFTLKRKEEQRRTKELLSCPCASSSGAKMAVCRCQIDLTPSVGSSLQREKQPNPGL